MQTDRAASSVDCRLVNWARQALHRSPRVIVFCYVQKAATKETL